MNEPTDIIICLGNGSMNGNDELRIMLRSLERHADDIGRMFVATHYAPKWLDSSKVTIVDIDDVFISNKDANLHRKTLETIRRYNVGKFCWLSDDVVFNSRTTLGRIPILHSDGEKETYDRKSTWLDRLRNTFHFAECCGQECKYSYDVHAPQTFDGQKLLEGMDGVDYEHGLGLTIFTAWRAVCGEIGTENEESVGMWKETLENAQTANAAKFDKNFIGYNDAAFNTYSFRKRLFAMFPEKSSFEKY